MGGEQRVRALKVGAGSQDDGIPPAGRAWSTEEEREAAERETHPQVYTRGQILGMARGLLIGSLRGVAVVLGVVTLTFFLHLAPGDPVQRLLGPAAEAAQIEAARPALGLDQPLARQYGHWLGARRAGISAPASPTGAPRPTLLAEAWPATALLVLLSILLSWTLGIAIGALQANTRRAPSTDYLGADRRAQRHAGLLARHGARHGVHLSARLASGIRRGRHGRGFPDRQRPAHRPASPPALPLLTLTLIGLGGTARFARAAMRELRDAPFLVAAEAGDWRNRGAGTSSATRWSRSSRCSGCRCRHSFPVRSSSRRSSPGPGGQVLVQAVQARDYPVVMAAATISAVLVVAGNLLAEFLVTITDPRIRDAAR